MTAKQIHLVKSTWTIIAVLNTIIEENLFYNRLLETEPQIILMLHSLMQKQRDALNVDTFVIQKLHKLDEIISEICKLSNPDVQYGNEARHYLTVGTTLLLTLSQGLNKQLSGKLRAAWLKCYTTLSNALIEATNYASQAA